MDQHLPFTTSHAFLIGINEYAHISSLGTAVKDATDIAELLQDETKHGYEVHLLTDAGKKDIEAFFQKMTELVEAEDRVIFYYAGHGIAIDSEGDPEGYLVPADAEPDKTDSLVAMKLLHETLSKLPCKHGLLVLDCCFAGAFKWSTGFRAINWGASEVLYAERFWRFVEHPAWQVITSSAHDQKAADVLNKQALGLREEGEEDSKDKNSPFAWAFKQAIDLHSKADTAGFKRSDGVITATELYIYLREIVETATLSDFKRQSPALFTLGKHDSKGEYIFLNPGHKLNLPEAPDLNPYKGLSPYENTDTQNFFGRSEAIKAMADKLAKTNILVISAPSGQGKSSVVKAGLFPFVQENQDAEPIILRPGDHVKSAWQKLGQMTYNSRQIVLIDQYEEIFALEEKERLIFEQLLSDLWLGIEQTENAQIQLILTLRSDFEWQLKTSSFGKLFWKESEILKFLYRLPPMSLEELKESMVKPAWTVAYEFESEELIDQILEEINHSPGALPLLSFTLHKLYEKRDRDQRLLTQKAYEEELGGVNGALSKHADEIYEKLPSLEHQDFMRKLMLRMVRLNDGSYSRRRVYLSYHENFTSEKPLNELDYLDHLDKRVEEVLEALTEHQLLIRGLDKIGTFVEPMHDSLINHWPRCLGWIQDFGRENLNLQRQLWQAVLDLYKPQEEEKDEKKQATKGQTPSLNTDTSLFWDRNPKIFQVIDAVMRGAAASLQAAGKNPIKEAVQFIEAELTGNDRERFQELMDAWNQNQKVPNLDAFLLSGASSKLLHAFLHKSSHSLNEQEVAFIQRSWELRTEEIMNLKRERDEARASALSSKARQMLSLDYTHALNIAHASYRLCNWIEETQQALHDISSQNGTFVYSQAIALDRGKIHDIAFTPEGKFLWMIEENKLIKWDLEAQRRIQNTELELPYSNRISFSLSPDAQQMITWGSPHIYKEGIKFNSHVWDWDNGWKSSSEMAFGNKLLDITFTQDGPRIVDKLSQTGISIRNEEREKLHEITGSWYLDNMMELSMSNSYPPDDISAMVLSPQNLELVQGDINGKMTIYTPNEHAFWDVGFEKQEEEGYICALSYSPDGKYFASGDTKGLINIWESQPPKKVASLRGNTSPISALAFSPDNKVLISVNEDQDMKIWSWMHEGALCIINERAPQGALTFSQDGKLLIKRGANGQVRIKNWQNEVYPTISLEDQEKTYAQLPLDSGKSSHDGKKFWQSGENQQASLLGFDIEPISFKGIPEPEGKFYTSPNGKFMVTFGSYGVGTYLWNLQEGKKASFFKSEDHQAFSFDLAFSSDNRYLAILGETRSESETSPALVIYDLEQEIIEGSIPLLANETIYSLAFSPDGRYLMGGGSSLFKNPEVKGKIWDRKSKEIIHEIRGFKHEIKFVEFSPDANYFLTGSGKVIKIWDFQSFVCLQTILCKQELAAVSYSPDGSYLARSEEEGETTIWQNLISKWDHSVYKFNEEERKHYKIPDSLNY